MTITKCTETNQFILTHNDKIQGKFDTRNEAISFKNELIACSAVIEKKQDHFYNSNRNWTDSEIDLYL